MDNNETEVYKKINSAKSMKKHRSDLYIDEMQEIINKHGFSFDGLCDIMYDCFNLGYYKGYNKCKNMKNK